MQKKNQKPKTMEEGKHVFRALTSQFLETNLQWFFRVYVLMCLSCIWWHKYTNYMGSLNVVADQKI